MKRWILVAVVSVLTVGSGAGCEYFTPRAVTEPSQVTIFNECKATAGGGGAGSSGAESGQGGSGGQSASGCKNTVGTGNQGVQQSGESVRAGAP